MWPRRGRFPVPNPLSPRRRTASPNRGPARQRRAPASPLPMLGAPAGSSPTPAAPPPAALAAAPAAGGGARRRLHPPAALPGQSRQHGPRGTGGGDSSLTAAGGTSPARTTGGFPTPVAPAVGRDLPVRRGHRLQPRAPAQPQSPPLALPRRPASPVATPKTEVETGTEARKVLGAGTERRKISRESPVLPAPPPPRSGSPPGPRLLPGAVTSQPGVARRPGPGARSG